MNQPDSGLLLFSQYALPCARKKMSEATYGIFKKIAEGNCEPSRYWLQTYFEKACDSYKETCFENGFEFDFSFDSVAFHWRNNHTNCLSPVTFAIVQERVGANQMIVKVSQDGKSKFSVGNPLKRQDILGKKVSIHGYCLIEVIEFEIAIPQG